MHAYQKFQKNYQRVEIQTADPLKIVVLLYEGAIKNLNQATRLMADDRTAACARIGKTQDIVNYLRNSLDHAQGGEIAFNLERLYEYVRDLLNDATIHADCAKVKEAVSLLQTLLEGWRGISTGQTEHDAGALGLERGEGPGLGGAAGAGNGMPGATVSISMMG
jgi:flagellar protein FliS